MSKSSNSLKRGLANSATTVFMGEIMESVFPKKHKYVSTINMEYYFFGDFYVRIQEGATSLLPDYALITTTMSFHSQNEYEFFKEKGLLEEITVEDFNVALNRAIKIIGKLSNNY